MAAHLYSPSLRSKKIASGRSDYRRGSAPGPEAFLTRRRLLCLGLLLLISGLAFLYLWQSWQMVYQLNRLQESRQRLAQLRSQRDLLQLEVARAFSLQRIEQFARRRLGMIYPSLKFLVLPPTSPRFSQAVSCPAAGSACPVASP